MTASNHWTILLDFWRRIHEALTETRELNDLPDMFVSLETETAGMVTVAQLHIPPPMQALRFLRFHLQLEEKARRQSSERNSTIIWSLQYRQALVHSIYKERMTMLLTAIPGLEEGVRKKLVLPYLYPQWELRFLASRIAERHEKPRANPQ